MYLVGKRSPSNLGFYRPNQAVQRSLIGLGQDATSISVDPTLLLAGGGLLVVAMLLWGGRKARRSYTSYRRRRRTRKRRSLQQKLAALG